MGALELLMLASEPLAAANHKITPRIDPQIKSVLTAFANLNSGASFPGLKEFRHLLVLVL